MSWGSSGRNMQATMSLMCVYFLSFLALVVVHVDAWTCAVEHPQTAYCRAHFAVKARVSNIGKQNNDQMLAMLGYKSINVELTLLKIFKGGDLLRDQQNVTAEINSKVVVRTLLHSHDRWEKDEEYLISGQPSKKGEDDHTGFVTRCHWIQKWKNITDVQYQGLNGYYARHCACQVKTCFPRKCGSKTKENQCMWDFRSEGYDAAVKKIDCASQISICLRGGQKENGDVICKWHTTQLKCKTYPGQEP